MIRRVLLVFLGAGAACLIPWTVYLAEALPDRYDTGLWRLAWVGFDIALLCCFAVAAWLGVRRHRASVPLLAATAALLCCDAWFDVVLDWTGPDRWTSVALAVLVEVPIAVFLVSRARSLLVGGMSRRALTMRDIEVHGDPSYRWLLRTLGDMAPVTVEALSGALDRPVDEVTATLVALGSEGYVRQDRSGRWSVMPQNLREPEPGEFAEAHRPSLAAYLDAKYDTELRLLTWAVSHRTEFGPWGKGHRATMHLTETELDAFDTEYNELLTRYSLLRRAPTSDTRDVAIRFYAFPTPSEPLDDALRGEQVEPGPPSA